MLLSVNDVSVNYGYVEALRHIHFYVDKGEIVTLIGSNGAGKTSTLKTISNIVKRTSGTIMFKDKDITGYRPNDIVALGMCHVPEGRQIFPYMSVKDNLIAGSFGNKKLSSTDREHLMEEMFEWFPRLKERYRQDGGTLSGGEQQMLAIARGLMMDPDIVMLDEPSLGLAPIVVEEIFELINKIRELGKTILLIEQNAAMALGIADRGYVMENGRITMTGTGQELLENEKVKAAYLGS
ncbi:ABC transporter ATP-binding protein [Oribacterium sp. WCC10]|uniref:ABC transporter ATP-binding protein n=1 Tax=Oribacterium sp. WCC10 TaxID=1855343 RepID=UPI0008E29EDB|nr:ABC transporter ATP-binding protein [Oribacterium sp. WCC10]SFG62448.1 branched-chain amino acid transport system ATP-binding protein [Oribacterium sp. WCC10]